MFPKFNPFSFQHDFEGEVSPNPVVAPAPPAAPVAPVASTTPTPATPQIPAQVDTAAPAAPVTPSEFERLKQSNAHFQTAYQNTLRYMEGRFGPEAIADFKQQNAQRPTAPAPTFQQPAQQTPASQIPSDLRIADLTPAEFAQLQAEIIDGRLSTFEQRASTNMTIQNERQVVGGMIGEVVNKYRLTADEQDAVMRQAASLFTEDDFKRPGQLTRYGQVYAQFAYQKRLETLLSGAPAAPSPIPGQAPPALPPGSPAPMPAQKSPVEAQLDRLRGAVDADRNTNISTFVRGA